MDLGKGKDLADSVCQILPMGILQTVSAEFPMVLIRQTLSGEFQHVEKEVKSLIWRKFLQRTHAYTLDINPLIVA